MVEIPEEEVMKLNEYMEKLKRLTHEYVYTSKKLENVEYLSKESQEFEQYCKSTLCPQWTKTYNFIRSVILAYNQDLDNWKYTNKKLILDAQLLQDEVKEMIRKVGGIISITKLTQDLLD